MCFGKLKIPSKCKMVGWCLEEQPESWRASRCDWHVCTKQCLERGLEDVHLGDFIGSANKLRKGALCFQSYFGHFMIATWIRVQSWMAVCTSLGRLVLKSSLEIGSCVFNTEHHGSRARYDSFRQTATWLLYFIRMLALMFGRAGPIQALAAKL